MLGAMEDNGNGGYKKRIVGQKSLHFVIFCGKKIVGVSLSIRKAYTHCLWQVLGSEVYVYRIPIFCGKFWAVNGDIYICGDICNQLHPICL